MIDGTVGMGGHAEAILSAAAAPCASSGSTRIPRRSRGRGDAWRAFGDRVALVHASFRRPRRGRRRAAASTRARSILLDLGVSSWQLDESGRGFSFQGDEPLDMRLDPTSGDTAADAPEPAAGGRAGADHLRVRRGAARAPHRARASSAAGRWRHRGDLVAAVRSAVPRAAWPRRLHVATRTFQAVRMAVNDEPGALRSALAQAPALLAAGGRLGVISFHSGEDRIVKQTFRALEPAGFAELEPSPRHARGRRGAGQPPRPEREAARAGAALMKKRPAASSRTGSPGAALARRGLRHLARCSWPAPSPSSACGSQQVHLAYRLDASRPSAGAPRSAIRQLEVEVATLRSPSRVEARARQTRADVRRAATGPAGP